MTAPLATAYRDGWVDDDDGDLEGVPFEDLVLVEYDGPEVTLTADEAAMVRRAMDRAWTERSERPPARPLLPPVLHPLERPSRNDMPPLHVIADYWRCASATCRQFLGLDTIAADWSRPFCFACSWRPPIEPGPDAWRSPAASSWLDRAHLLENARGGSSFAENLVPLCHLCHDAMPPQGTYDRAAAWVARRTCELPEPARWQAFTDATQMDRWAASTRKVRTYRLRGDYLLALITEATR